MWIKALSVPRVMCCALAPLFAATLFACGSESEEDKNEPGLDTGADTSADVGNGTGGSCTLDVAVSPSLALPTTYGGEGGDAHELHCPEGSFVRGFYGRTGRYLDSLGLHCAPFELLTNEAGTCSLVDSTTTVLPLVGGEGGGGYHFHCPPAHAVHAISGHAGEFVSVLTFHCLPVSLVQHDGVPTLQADHDAITSSQTIGPYIEFGADFEASCKSEEHSIGLVTGLDMRAGMWLDKLAVRCGQLSLAD